MLDQFLCDNRRELIDRCRLRAAQRSPPRSGATPAEHGIPVFLDQLIGCLRSAESSAAPQMGTSAASHGAELLRNDFTIDQVVHDYGDLCQAVMELAIERGAVIEVAEFRTLNLALDDAIADAVTEYCSGSSTLVAERGMRAETERLGHLAHELRNQVHTATLALAAIKAGNVGVLGATGALLDRTMAELRRLVDRALMTVRASSPLGNSWTQVKVAELMAKVGVAAELEARSAKCAFTLGRVDSQLAVRADPDVLIAALGNLLQNAFKFSHKHGDVSLNVHQRGDRLLFEVADRCGGLPAGLSERIFDPFVQASSDRTGLGLGLAIVKRGVEANDGMLTVRDAPPVGCVFTIDLPCAAPAASPAPD
jgi:signal transduction histidine kinase